MIGFASLAVSPSSTTTLCSRSIRMCSSAPSRVNQDVFTQNSKPANLRETHDRSDDFSALYENILRSNENADIGQLSQFEDAASDEPKDELERLENLSKERKYSSEYIASKLLESMSPSATYSTEDEELMFDDIDGDHSVTDENEEDDSFETSSKEFDSLYGLADEAPVVTSEELAFKLSEIKHLRQTVIDRNSNNSNLKSSDDAKSVGMCIQDIKLSMRAAEVIPSTGQTPKPYNALTAMSEVIAEERSQFPFIAEPVPALQQAFIASKSTTCKVCGSTVRQSELEYNLMCVLCYSKIFIQIDSPRGELEVDKLLRSLPGDVRTSIQQLRTERRKLTRNRLGRVAPKMKHESVWEMKGASNSQTRQSRNTTGFERSFSSYGNMPPSPPDFPPPPVFNDGGSERSDEWEVRASTRSLHTINPIRNLVQGIDVKPNPSLDVIKLSVGDPTVYGNLKVSEYAIDEYCSAIRSMKHNGYSMSMGSLEARTAVANRYTLPNAPLNPNDVVLTSGTSGAIELAIGALANEGDNILLPRPGFPLFRTIAQGFGVECRNYDLIPNQEWEIDLKKVHNLVDNRTVAIVVNNPSNPCGSVYSKQHIREILKTAAELHLPIIADEVYADMVFAGNEFTSIASESVEVPVLSVGGISKQFVVPGWRLGWILIHDRNCILEDGNIRTGIRQLTTRMLVPNSPAQAVVPSMLKNGVKDDSFQALMHELELNASFTVQALASAPGLRCIAPQGAMYTMAEVDVELLGFQDDMEFTKALLAEESVFVLPGQCFQAPNFVRIVFCAPHFVLSEAFHRIRRFCKKHAGVSRL